MILHGREIRRGFAIVLRPGGRFTLTPLCNVISAQPSVDSKQIPGKNFRLAMSFGTKPHYPMRQIAPRHFLQTAILAGMGKGVVPSVIDELCSYVKTAVDRVNAELPSGFPAEVADSISNGITRRLRILEAGEREQPDDTSS